MLEDVIQPAAVIVGKRRGRIAFVVNLGREAALIVAARERSVQVENRVAVVGSQGQPKLRQALRQCGREDFVPVRLGGARDEDGVVPARQPFAGVVDELSALQDKVDLDGSAYTVLHSFKAGRKTKILRGEG